VLEAAATRQAFWEEDSGGVSAAARPSRSAGPGPRRPRCRAGLRKKTEFHRHADGCRARKKIEVIKRFRALTGLGLKESQETWSKVRRRPSREGIPKDEAREEGQGPAREGRREG